jgi:uncharacterized protein
MPKKRTVLLTLLCMVMLIIATACGGGNNKAANGNEEETAGNKSGSTVDLLMGTGSQGGTYYPLGAEMANVWNKNIENVNVTSTESGASIENLAKIANGEFDLGMTVNLPAYDAYKGKGNFEGRKVENFAFIGHIYPEVLQIVTRESLGINSIADLKGKRIAIGPPGSGTQTIAKIVLAAFGIKDGDYEAYQEGYGDAKAKLQDGTIDAWFGLLGLPDAGIDELQASVKDAKFLEITGEQLAYVEKNSGYTPYTIKSGSYEWLNKDVSTVSAFAILVANTDTVDEDLAYQLTKVMIEKANENTHQQAKHMTKENALNGRGDLPIHPGAEKYYKEIGILK